LANKQPETAAPRAGIYWRYVDSFEYLARDWQTNSQKQLRQGREFTGDMLILWRILARDWQAFQLPRRQGGEFTIDTYFVFGERLAQFQQKHRKFTSDMKTYSTAYTVKKFCGFPVPSREVTYQTLLGRE
jgi:hypothetical protein